MFEYLMRWLLQEEAQPTEELLMPYRKKISEESMLPDYPIYKSRRCYFVPQFADLTNAAAWAILIAREHGVIRMFWRGSEVAVCPTSVAADVARKMESQRTIDALTANQCKGK